MKKNLLKGMMVLFASTAFVACSHDTDFESVAQDNVKNQYREAFIKKYGEINPNQSWDFTNTPAQARMTRGGETVNIPTLIWEKISLDNAAVDKYWDYSAQDLAGVQAKLEDTSIKAEKWKYKNVEINIHPTYAHHNTSTSFYVALGVEYSYDGKSYTTAPNHNKKAQTTVGDNEISMRLMYQRWYAGWYYPDVVPGTYNSNFNSWCHADTYGLKNATSFNWWVGYYSTSSDAIKKTNIDEEARCKFFTVNGREYVAFDVDGNKDFSDLICWIEVIPQESSVIAKRYMVEDLGSFSDFDFNDIVFDVIQDADGNQECIVRALGGIYDIEISIGGENGSKWKKSDAVADYTQMINTLDPEYTKIVNKEMDPVIARFPIQNNVWLPAENNVVVTVYPSEYQSIRLPFPENGVVPFMVAVKPTKMWNPEYLSVDDVPGWFSDAE